MRLKKNELHQSVRLNDIIAINIKIFVEMIYQSNNIQYNKTSNNANENVAGNIIYTNVKTSTSYAVSSNLTLKS